jgi:hypothetical protein
LLLFNNASFDIDTSVSESTHVHVAGMQPVDAVELDDEQILVGATFDVNVNVIRSFFTSDVGAFDVEVFVVDVPDVETSPPIDDVSELDLAVLVIVLVDPIESSAVIKPMPDDSALVGVTSDNDPI